MKETNRPTPNRTLPRALACGFLLALLLGWLRTAAAAQQLPESVLRLHVVANSDSPEDQALKLAVRDAVLAEAGKYCANASSLEEANFQVCTHLESITRAAQDVIAQWGAEDRARAQVAEQYFPTKEYGGFTLPAGRYRALRVVIGEGAGRNWWCVVFPALCLPAAGEEDPLALLPEGQREAAQSQYKVGFKLAEWFEEFKHWLG